MKKIHKFSALLLTGLMFIATLITSIGGVGANTISISGLDAGSAVVTDDTGKTVTGQNDLSKYRAYTVKYQGSIPDSTQINNGDTATFTAPSNVQIAANQTCNVYDQNGNIAGTASIQAGSHTGVITFNNDLHGKISRTISLSIGTIGTTTTTTNNSNVPGQGSGNTPSGNNNPGALAAAINKVGWFDKTNQNIIHWDVVANLHNANLTDPVITDNMGPGMELVPGSIKVQEGYYVNGAFTGAIDAPNPQVTTNGSEMKISLPSTNLAIHVTYEAKITNTNESQYANKATISAANLTQTGTDSATLPGTIKGGVTYKQGGINVMKVDANTNKPLAGAKFALFTKGHESVGEATTGADGIAHFTGLDAGDYYLKEIVAPKEYHINNKLYPVNVPDTKTTVKISVPDTIETSSSSSSSSSSSKSSSSKSSSSSSSSKSSSSKSLSSSSSSKSSSSKSLSSSSSKTVSSHKQPVPVKSVSSSSHQTGKSVTKESSKTTGGTKHQSKMPQTGEEALSTVAVLGVLLVISGAVVFEKKR